MQIIARQSVSDYSKCTCDDANSNCIHQSNLNNNSKVRVKARVRIRIRITVRARVLGLGLGLVPVVTRRTHIKKAKL